MIHQIPPKIKHIFKIFAILCRFFIHTVPNSRTLQKTKAGDFPRRIGLAIFSICQNQFFSVIPEIALENIPITRPLTMAVNTVPHFIPIKFPNPNNRKERIIPATQLQQS